MKNNDWKERLNVVYSTNRTIVVKWKMMGTGYPGSFQAEVACSIGSQESRRKSSHTCHGFRRYGK